MTWGGGGAIPGQSVEVSARSESAAASRRQKEDIGAKEVGRKRSKMAF